MFSEDELFSFQAEVNSCTQNESEFRIDNEHVALTILKSVV